MVKASQSTWPVWRNGRINLFHGTTLEAARNILSSGVDLAFCRENTDFGIGFYTTTLESSAWKIARRKVDIIGGTQAVIRLHLDREKLGSLKTLAFVRGSLDATDFWSYVYSCRKGLRLLTDEKAVYDVVYGPVASSWAGPANSKLYEGFDQISFHTQAALNLLKNGEVCRTVIL